MEVEVKLLVSLLLLCFCLSAEARNGDEQCIKWTQHTETVYNQQQASGPGWNRHQQNSHPRQYWTRVVKECVAFGPSYVNKISKDISESLNSTLQKNNTLMMESLDKIEDIVGESMELQYQDFIKKLKAELEKIKQEIKG